MAHNADSALEANEKLARLGDRPLEVKSLLSAIAVLETHIAPKFFPHIRIMLVNHVNRLINQVQTVDDIPVALQEGVKLLLPVLFSNYEERELWKDRLIPKKDPTLTMDDFRSLLASAKFFNDPEKWKRDLAGRKQCLHQINIIFAFFLEYSP